MHKVLAIGLAVLAAGCTAHRTDGGIDIDPVSDVIGNWSSTLEPWNNSGISGMATVQSRAVGAKVTVLIMGGMNGSVHPWHLHRGSCGTDKGIVGGASEYKALTVGTDGRARAEEDVPVALNEDDSYFINVHKSASDLAVVACGALKH